MKYTKYSSNNSGGDWWLKDEDWYALEAAGWLIEWAWLENVWDEDKDCARDENGLPILRKSTSDDHSHREEGERWLGALAKIAYRSGLSLREAAKEWQEITKANPLEGGCPCCGPPHSFTEYDENGKYICSGPDPEYHCEW